MTADPCHPAPQTAAEIEAAADEALVARVPAATKVPMHFMSRTEVAEYLGLAGLHSLTGVELPDPDVIVGDRKGWTEATIDAWQAARPGRGRWGPRDQAG